MICKDNISYHNNDLFQPEINKYVKNRFEEGKRKCLSKLSNSQFYTVFSVLSSPIPKVFENSV